MFKKFFSIAYAYVSKYEFIMVNIMINDSGTKKSITHFLRSLNF